MNRSAVAQQITDFLKSITANELLVPGTNLFAAGLIDSLTMMDLVCFLEGQFQVRLGVNDITPANFQSAQTLANLVEQRTAHATEQNAA